MANTAQHVATIINLAGQADALIAQLRPILSALEAEETALYKDAAQSGKPESDIRSGRRRLAQYAQDQVFRPQSPDTVTALAGKAWEAYL
jgi:hypothetical protein